MFVVVYANQKKFIIQVNYIHINMVCDRKEIRCYTFNERDYRDNTFDFIGILTYDEGNIYNEN